MKVALLGAAGTGKSCLAQALARHWPAHHFLDAPELSEASTWDRVLLMGLDCPDSGSEPDAARQARRRAEDAHLRVWLSTTGRTYGVVYGQGSQRLRAAMQLLFPQEIPSEQSEGRWRGPCETCADPDCEFRLFSRLANRASSPIGPSSSKAVGLPPG